MATLGDIDALVQATINLSRPTTQAERTAAINHGYMKGVRAVASARPDYFRQEGMLTIGAGVVRVLLLTGLSAITKPVLRVAHIGGHRVGAPSLYGAGSISGARDVLFQRASEQSDRFQTALREGAWDSDVILYDLVYESGQPLLAIAPAQQTATDVLLATIYRPTMLVNLTDVLEPALDDAQDMIVAYALAWLLRGVNDAEKREWWEIAEGLRGELLAHLGPATEQNTDHFDTGLTLDDV